MAIDMGSPQASERGEGEGAVVHGWAAVLHAGTEGGVEAVHAMDRLCRTFWYPLYVYLRRRGCGPGEAERLLRQFFVRFIERAYLEEDNPGRPVFRRFVLGCLQRFLELDSGQLREDLDAEELELGALDLESAPSRFAQEPEIRGGAEECYHRRWALVLSDAALRSLGEECRREGRWEAFEQLEQWGFRVGSEGGEARPGGKGEVDPRTMASLRMRYRQWLRWHVALTVAEARFEGEEFQWAEAALAEAGRGTAGGADERPRRAERLRGAGRDRPSG